MTAPAMSGPVFVAGADRSGIGLVGDLLDAHPAFAISRRTNFWTFYWGRFGDVAQEANLDRCIEALMRFRRIRDLGIDPERLRSDFLDSQVRSYRRLFELIGRQHAEGRRKRRWGDKSLNSERHADLIMSEFSQAHMVHVIRDPRDRHASVVAHRGGRRGGAAVAAAVWSESVRRARIGQQHYGERYHVIRYEDLVADPLQVLTRLCRLLGEEFDPSMLSGVEPLADGGTGNRINPSSVGRYKDDLSRLQARFMDRILAREMGQWGYGSDDRPLSRRDRALLTSAGLPLGRLLMVGWRPWSAAKSAFSSGPSARRLVD
ncbi:MAG: sulfotransferase [Acidimicrobiia bacterium]